MTSFCCGTETSRSFSAFALRDDPVADACWLRTCARDWNSPLDRLGRAGDGMLLLGITEPTRPSGSCELATFASFALDCGATAAKHDRKARLFSDSREDRPGLRKRGSLLPGFSRGPPTFRRRPPCAENSVRAQRCACWAARGCENALQCLESSSVKGGELEAETPQRLGDVGESSRRRPPELQSGEAPSPRRHRHSPFQSLVRPPKTATQTRSVSFSRALEAWSARHSAPACRRPPPVRSRSANPGEPRWPAPQPLQLGPGAREDLSKRFRTPRGTLRPRTGASGGGGRPPGRRSPPSGLTSRKGHRRPLDAHSGPGRACTAQARGGEATESEGGPGRSRSACRVVRFQRR